MNSTTSSTAVLASATTMAQADVQLVVKASGSWLGMLGRMVLFLIEVVPGVLYWFITFSTITMPTFLFTLFSTSLTFTMNATTL
jgi:lysophospholipid hydrolase